VKIPKRFGYLAALCVVLLPALVSCKQLVVKTPAGFAALQSADQYAAMSPEGMIYRVRVMHNSPKQSLSFWTEALTNHLQQEGYVPVSTDNEFQAGTLRGTFSEWSVPYADDTYKYLTGILVGDETIAVVEATSSHDVYDRHRAAVLKAWRASTSRVWRRRDSHRSRQARDPPPPPPKRRRSPHRPLPGDVSPLVRLCSPRTGRPRSKPCGRERGWPFTIRRPVGGGSS
jgi:hypothetical protein